MANLLDIEGVGDKYAGKLRAAGITTTQKLLEMGSSPKGRKEIADKTGIGDALILEWVNHVDLMRIYWKKREWTPFLSWPNANPKTSTKRWSKSITERN